MKTLKLSSLRPLLIIAIMLLLSTAGFSQDPGDNPDGPPPAVPFEDYMHFILIIAGAVFALFAIKRIQKQQVS